MLPDVAEQDVVAKLAQLGDEFVHSRLLGHLVGLLCQVV
jgi:hypothetical protein